MKRRISMSLVILMTAILLAGAGPAQAASAKSKAYKAYRTWINKGAKDTDGDKYSKFCLVNIDADKVPELVASFTRTGVTEYYVQSYKNGKLVHQTLMSGVAEIGGFRGSAYYLPGKGKMRTAEVSVGGMGSAYDTVYKLTKKGFSVYRKGSYDGIFDTGSTNILWNGKHVAMNQYDKALKKAFNMAKAKSFEDLKFVSRSKIIKSLK